MSDKSLAQLIAELLFSIFLIFYGIHLWSTPKKNEKSDEPFGEYQNLADCIAKQWGKRRDPEQYCRAIRSKVRRARRRKYGR